nr:U5 small nuclear ribonucleoprotein helicase [Tanacetum cinerariifolium]
MGEASRHPIFDLFYLLDFLVERTLLIEDSKMSRQASHGTLVGLKPKSTFVYRPISTKKAKKANGNPKVMNKASTSKPSTSMRDQLVESDEDEVELPDDKTSRYMSSTDGGGFCKDDLDFYDGYE